MATIGINTLFLIPNQVGGTEYLTRAFIDAVANDTTHQYVLFCNRENADTFQVSRNMRKVVCPITASNRVARILYEQFQFPFALKAERCDLLHSFGYTAPVFASCPQITTVHDTNWLDHPDDFSWLTRNLTDVLVRSAIRVSSVVITDSSFAKTQLQRHFPNAKEKISVVLPIIDPRMYSPPYEGIPSEIAKGPYALCVSALYPHKNIPYLLRLWNRFATDSTTPTLVLVGRHGKDTSRVQDLLKDSPNVIYYPKVSYTLLKSLYHHAAIFVHPSTYEGFGIPVYEAYRAGLPILVGKRALYEPRIQDDLHSLSFDMRRDHEMIESVLLEPKRTRSLWSTQDSLQSLLTVYDQVLSRAAI